jgi:Mn2+/Fe2+ NRAMP family transporter
MTQPSKPAAISGKKQSLWAKLGPGLITGAADDDPSGGVVLNFTPVDPIKALFCSAVINGVISVPIMVVMMLMAVHVDIMGGFVISRWLRIFG